jgi:hypothetical protein
VTHAHQLSDGRVVAMERLGGKVILTVPEEDRDPIDTVVVLE